MIASRHLFVCTGCEARVGKKARRCMKPFTWYFERTVKLFWCCYPVVTTCAVGITLHTLEVVISGRVSRVTNADGLWIDAAVDSILQTVDKCCHFLEATRPTLMIVSKTVYLGGGTNESYWTYGSGFSCRWPITAVVCCFDGVYIMDCRIVSSKII